MMMDTLRAFLQGTPLENVKILVLDEGMTLQAFNAQQS